MVLKVRKIGNSLVVTLPVEVASKLDVREGDTVHLIESQNGFELTSFDPEFETAMRIWREASGRYRNALRELA